MGGTRVEIYAVEGKIIADFIEGPDEAVVFYGETGKRRAPSSLVILMQHMLRKMR